MIIRLGRWQILKIKDIRKARMVLFSDRYVSYHIGPFAVRLFHWPKHLRSNEQATRFEMRWRKREAAE